MLTYKHLLPQGATGRREADNKKGKKHRGRGSDESLAVDSELKIGFDTRPTLSRGQLGSGQDSLTKQILAEGNFLPRKAQGIEDREFPLKSQTSFPEVYAGLKSVGSGTLGMGGLNYTPLVRSKTVYEKILVHITLYISIVNKTYTFFIIIHINFQKLSRVYGRTDNLPIFNLTGIHHKSPILYAASNVAIFFTY